jgi:hypothetical protein
VSTATASHYRSEALICHQIRPTLSRYRLDHPRPAGRQQRTQCDQAPTAQQGGYALHLNEEQSRATRSLPLDVPTPLRRRLDWYQHQPPPRQEMPSPHPSRQRQHRTAATAAPPTQQTGDPHASQPIYFRTPWHYRASKHSIAWPLLEHPLTKYASGRIFMHLYNLGSRLDSSPPAAIANKSMVRELLQVRGKWLRPHSLQE